MVKEIAISVALLFVGISALVLLHICIVRRVFGTEYPGGGLGLESSPGERPSSSTLKMSTEDLSRLPCYDHVVESAGGRIPINIGDCAVCLDSFKGGEKCRSMPDCGHYFHARCIDSWLLKTSICPICRAAVSSPGPSKNSVLEGNAPVVVVVDS